MFGDGLEAETITAHAGHLASRHALRGADAVHLASLLAVGLAETLFAVWDPSNIASAVHLRVRRRISFVPQGTVRARWSSIGMFAQTPHSC